MHEFEHRTLDKTAREEKARIRTRLLALEHEFLAVLSNTPIRPKTDKELLRQQELRRYLQAYPVRLKNGRIKHKSLLEQFKHDLPYARMKHHAIRAFSVFSALFMSLGTTYLLVEVFALLPFLAVIPVAILPALIIPMAIISGLAYGLLTYNSITNMLTNSSMVQNVKQLMHEFKTQGFTLRNTLMAVANFALLALAVGLTLCTAGTWWTIVQETRPLFTWMSHSPRAVLALGTALVNSLSALAFNLENSSESLNQIHNAPTLSEVWQSFITQFKAFRADKNLVQLFNPFRILLLLTITPLRICLFIGHLISIGVTADRMPGIPAVVSALLGIISEGFEDLHYFIDIEAPHDSNVKALLKEHFSGGTGHNHQDDLPTRLLNFISLPVHGLVLLWDKFGDLLPAPTPPAQPRERDLEAQIPAISLHTHTSNCRHPFFSSDFCPPTTQTKTKTRKKQSRVNHNPVNVPPVDAAQDVTETCQVVKGC